MLLLSDDSLSLVFGAPWIAAVMLFALSRAPFPWLRIAVALSAHALALGTAIVLGERVLARGGFAFVDIDGWVGAAIEGVDPLGLAPSILAPTQVPLLVAVEVAGLVAAILLVPAAVRQQRTGPLAALLFATGAVALLVVARRTEAICAAFSLAGIGGFALLVVHQPRRAEAEGAARAFVLHRVGDALMLFGLVVVARSVHAGELDKLVEIAPTIDPWTRAESGPFVGFAAREAWGLMAALVVCGAASRLAFGPLLPLVQDATGAPGASLGFAHGVCFLGAGLLLLARMSPILWLSPEVMTGLGAAAILSMFVAALFALVSRDAVRLDLHLLAAFAALATLAQAAADVATAVLGSTLAIAAAVPLCATSGAVVEQTRKVDPFALGGLEPLMPRTHTARLLVTGALFGPAFTGFVLVAQSLKGCLFAPWLGAPAALLLTLTVPFVAVAAFRPLHLVFTGPAPREPASTEMTEPPLTRTLPPLLVGLPLLGLGLLQIPDGVLAALPVATTYQPPVDMLALPERIALAPLRNHVLSPWSAPAVGPIAVAAAAFAALLVGWLVSTLLYRAGPTRLHRMLLGAARVQRVVAFAAAAAGRESQVARGVGDGAVRLSRLIATRLAPGVLDTLLRRVPVLLGALFGAVVRFTANGSAQRGVAITLLVLAALLLWWGRP